jgi:hypothetical protein
VAGHAAVEALAAAALLAGFVLLVRRSGLPRGWPSAAPRRRWTVRATAFLALTGATFSAAIAASLLAAAPVASVALLLAAGSELVLGARWLARPRLVTADRLVGTAAAASVGWLVAWSGVVPMGGHLEPGPDQALALVLQVGLLLWLILATYRPAMAPPVDERVRWPHEGLLAPGGPAGVGARAGVGGRFARSR